jgi:hypothetical protein
MRLRLLICCAIFLVTGHEAYPGTGEKTPRSSFIGNGSLNNINLIVGLRGGINFTQPLVMDHFEVIQGNDPAVAYNKDYSPLFVNPGYHYAFVFMVYLKKTLSLSFEPAMASYRYKYRLSTDWTSGGDPTDYIAYTADHSNAVNYLEFPLTIRQEIGGKDLKPFVSIGLIYGYRLTAVKKMEYSIDRNQGTVSIPIESNTVISNNTDTYIHSRFAVAAGFGFLYSLGPANMMLSADFSFGLNNIVDESQRYSNPSITSGMYDVQDNIRLSALNITLGILFNTGKNQAGKAVECVTFKRKR